MKSLRLVLIALSLTACTPKEQPYAPNPLTEPKLEKNQFRTADDVALPYRAWLPKNPKAVVVALHGMNDYSNAFADTGKFLSGRDIAVYAYDQRGFGGTPQAGIWGNNDNLKNDLKQFVSVVAKKHSKLPIYILGESMGGAVAIASLADGDFPKVDGLILSAPAVWGGDSMNPLFRGVLWTMAHTMPSKTMTGSDLKILASDNIPMLIALGKDPLIIKATRTDAVYGLVAMMDAAYESVPNLNTKILLLYGANDQVIPKDPIEISLARFNHPITFAFYPEGYHMLLRDLQSELVLTDIESWIKYSEAPLPSGFAREIAPLSN